MTRNAQTVTLSQVDDLTIQMVDPGSYDYSQAELEAAFERVQNREHWKGVIDCVIELAERERDLMWVAIVHFTATVPTFKLVGMSNELTGPLVHVEADGYWAGPAA